MGHSWILLIVFNIAVNFAGGGVLRDFVSSSLAGILGYQSPATIISQNYENIDRGKNAESTRNNSSENALHYKNPKDASDQGFGELSRRKCFEYYPKLRLGVAGGEKSLPKEFPHMAAIGYEGSEGIEWLCGGSLISKKFVLTAAHCVKNGDFTPKYVRLGDSDLATDEDDARPQNFTILRSIPHPYHNPPVKYHDIALLELDREANFDEYVSPACLYTENDVKEPKLIATGWGKTGFSELGSSHLLKVELDHVPYFDCVDRYGKYRKEDLPRGIHSDLQICAGKMKGQDTCPGDSGGPLQFLNVARSFVINVHNIVGITSFGKACAVTGAPGIYTKVYNYIPWIESIAWGNETEH